MFFAYIDLVSIFYQTMVNLEQSYTRGHVTHIINQIHRDFGYSDKKHVSFIWRMDGKLALSNLQSPEECPEIGSSTMYVAVALLILTNSHLSALFTCLEALIELMKRG